MNRSRYKEELVSLGMLLAAALLIVIPLSSTLCNAQVTTGSVKGVVADSSGAVIPDADVSAKNVATGVETKVKTNSDGIYNFPKLQPGVYTLTIIKQGFKKQDFEQVTVALGQTVSLDAVLQTGQLTETVTVTAAGEELIQKEEVQVSNTFETRKVEDLPSNAAGGGIDTLALLAPGVVPGFGNVNSNGETLSVNGNRARSNNFTIDGGDNNDLSIGGPAFFVDNQDTVAEFQVITNNFSAEYGRNQGAIVNIVTKAGTNSYHGTAGWFHRDSNFLNSLNNIEKRSSSKPGGMTGPSPDLFNIGEGTIGGPIKKDKLFFFGSFQYLRDQSTFVSRSNNPTIAASDLSALKAAFPGNSAISALASASAFAITNFGSVTPRSDRAPATVNIGGKTFNVAYPQRAFAVPQIEKEFSARGDYKINDKNSIWYRHFYQTVSFANALGGSAGFTGNEPASGNLATATWTSQISGTSVNEFRFVWDRLSVIFGGGCTGFNCIPDPGQILNTYPRISFGIRASDGSLLQSIGPATNLPQGRVVTVYQFSDNFSKVLGKHQLKFGADIHRLTNSVPFLPNVNGSFTFSTSTQLATNNPAQVQLAVGQVTIDYTETDQFYYFQDDWKVKDNLTLNLGVRYENTGQPINLLHDLSATREANAQTAIWLQSLPLSVRTVPKEPADNNNWAPRLGFAWSPRTGDSGIWKSIFGGSDKTVISGGYSIAYDPAFYNIMLNISTSSPLVFLNTTVNPSSGAIFPFPATATGSAVQAFAKSAGLIRTNAFDPRFFSQTIVAPGFHSPYSEQWSLRWQREFNRNNVFEVRYVGTHGVGLFQTVNRNPRFDHLLNGFTAGGFTFPGFPNLVPASLKPQVAGVGTCVDNPATTTLNEGSQCNGRLLPESLVRSRENTAQSIYHGLQTRYQARLFNQLSVGASYTFAKALDNASEIFTFLETSVPQDPFSYRSERGYSGFDRRHALALNYIWDVPWMKEQKGLVGHVLGGWQLNGVYFLASGQRYTPSDYINTNILGAGKSYEDATADASFFGLDGFRPFIGNPNAPKNMVAISQVDAALIGLVDPTKVHIDTKGFFLLNALNAAHPSVVVVTKDQVAYIVDGPGAASIFGTPFGNASRGSLIGPRLNNLNLGLFKNIRLKERLTMQLQLNAYNALNHPNPGVGFIQNGTASETPDRFVEDAGSPDGFNDFGGIGLARRVIQIGIKFVF